jgi:DNA-binding GntR family transcriptional regulator
MFTSLRRFTKVLTKGIIIADEIERRIRENEWPDGRIPTVKEFVAEYSTSNRTIAQSFEALKARNLIYTRPGKGAFVMKGIVK